MNCRTARTLLLAAEVADLEGRGDHDLSTHLQSCTRCRVLAAELLEAMGELRRELEVEDAGVPPVRRAVLEAERRRARARLLARVVPLAAAAGLAGLLLVRRDTQIIPGAMPPRAMVHDVSVTAPPGRSVAVLHTDDPNIVIIWFF